MIRKLLEAFFRHKLLLLLPPVLIPGIVTPLAFMSNPPVYEASVGVWIDRPAYLNYKDGTPSWISEVQNQSSRLTELLHTRAFLTDVAQRTSSLAPLANSAAGQARIADLITKDVFIGGAAVGSTPGNGEHLLVIRVQSTTAQLAYELCGALVNAYQEKTAADQVDQAGAAVDFYQAQAQDAQQKLSKASQDLRSYALSHPLDPSDTGTSALPPAMLDPKLAALQSALQATQADYTNAQNAMKQAQQDATMSAEGRQYGFQVLDAPQLPSTPTPQIKKILIYPIAAAIAGLGLSAMLLVLLVASDRSVRSELELAPGLRVLGAVPLLRVKRVPKKFRSVATRRAIGSNAGMALPAAGGAK